MRLERLVDQVAPEWRSEFVQFIQTGEASDEFLSYLDSDPGCQQAVEEAFSAQSAAFEAFARLLQSPEELAAAVSSPRSEDVAHELSSSLLEAIELTGDEQHEVIELVSRALRSGLSREKREKATDLVADLDRTVSGG